MRELQRPQKSAAEIESLPRLGTTERMSHVREHGSSFAPETLVYLIREGISLGDTTFVETCARFLLGRESGDSQWIGGCCEATIAKQARRFGFRSHRELLLAFRSGCLAALWKAIYAGRERKPYWEERFGVAFKMTCIDTALALRRPRHRDMEAGLAIDSEATKDVDELDPELELLDDALVRRLSHSKVSDAVAQAILALPKRQGQAMFLRYLEGREIEGDGDGTVAKVMAVSPRAVYTHLEKGLKNLRANPDLRAIWQDEV